MSAAARKMMEKMGWKEGQGLGKDKDGVKSYLKVVRRDAHTATGLGHMADPTQGGSLASTHAVELDGVYSSLVSQRKTRRTEGRSRRKGDESESESESSDDASSASSGSGKEVTAVSKAKKPRREVAHSASASTSSSSVLSSSSSSDSDSDTSDNRAANTHHDITRMSDEDLFARCGGVRLGRAGRHRFFDGKLSRIATSNSAPSSPTADAPSSSVERKNAPTKKGPVEE